MKQTIWTPKFIVKSALIAALYVAITGLFAPFGFGMVQIRLSDVLIVLALYTFSAVPGLSVGCLIANILWSPYGFLDVLLGTLATFVGALGCYAMRRHRLMALAPTVIANALLVPVVFLAAGEAGYFLNLFYIGISQAIVCYALGLPASHLLDKQFGAKLAD